MLLAAGPRFGVDGAFERYLRVPYTLRRDLMDAAVDRLVLAWRAAPGGDGPRRGRRADRGGLTARGCVAVLEHGYALTSTGGAAWPDR